MKNPSQLRAAHALAIAGEVKARQDADEGNAVSGFPALIIRCGLMPTLAFATERGRNGSTKRDAFARVAQAIARHLEALHTGENLVAPEPATAEGLLKKLAASDAAHLRRCTQEALEYLSYLKRFAS